MYYGGLALSPAVERLSEEHISERFFEILRLDQITLAKNRPASQHAKDTLREREHPS
jgi:hypothetical protein